jgi:peptidoglycan-associated lipoprotein
MRLQPNTVSLAKLFSLFVLVSIIATGCTSCRIFGGRGEGAVPGAGETGEIEDILPGAGDLALRPPAEEPKAEDALQTVHFDYDSSVLTPQTLEKLRENLEWLKDQPDVAILIEGHCDERGTVEYNLSLGDRRASSVRSFLIKNGIDAKRLHIISYGKERPVDPGMGEAHWWKNRRAEFRSYE